MKSTDVSGSATEKEMSLVQTAKAAVEADRNGNIDDAIEHYIKCVELIMNLISKSEKKDSEELKILKKRGEECTSINLHSNKHVQLTLIILSNTDAARAEELKRLRLEQLPSSPGTTSEMTQSNNTDPSFKTVGATALTGATGGLLAGVAVLGAPVTLTLAGGIGGAYLATRQDKTGETARNIGESARSTFNKVQDVDRKYEISTKTKQAAVKTYQSAVDIEKKYDLSGKAARTAQVVSEAATSGIQYAKKVDEKYDLSGKTAAVAKAGWEGAKAGTQKLSEVNEKYKISEKATNAASSAWNFVSGVIGSGDNNNNSTTSN